MSVYLSGPIIHTEHRRNEFYRAVINAFEREKISVFAPQFLKALNPREIYERDVKHLRDCHIVVAEVTHPSHGVGMEIMLAIEMTKPIIMFYQRGVGRLSRMILGAPGKVMFEYSTIDEVVEFLKGIDVPALVINKCSKCDSEVAEQKGDWLRCIGCGEKNTRG